MTVCGAPKLGGARRDREVASEIGSMKTMTMTMTMTRKRVDRLLLSFAAVLSGLFTLAPTPSSAGPQPIQTFYVPVPEDQLLTAFQTLAPGLGDTTIRTTIAVTVAGNGTLLYYDHWEDGYEADLANPVQAPS